MKRLTAAIAAGAVALVLAAPAQPASPTNRQLAKQIKTLQKQVKTLQKQVKTAQTLALGAVVYAGCSIAVTADAFQGTWAAINTREATTIFPPESQVNDVGACTDWKVTRAPTANPANLTPFKALLSIFTAFG